MLQVMALKRMDSVGIVVENHDAPAACFTEMGLELMGEAPVEGPWVHRLIAQEGVRVDTAMMQAPDGHGRLELSRFRMPKLEGR